jgi:putative ABC transport system permease protein
VSGELGLGLRLARGRDRGTRLRLVGTILAHTAGTWIVLVVLAAARAEIALPSYDGDGVPLVAITVVATVALPVVVLLATVARLSAALRDRRLASLRVLGLSASRTRVVAAVEAGAGAVAGSLLGLVAFWISRPAVRGLDVAGRDWSASGFVPWSWSAVLVVVGMPLVAVSVALVPTLGAVSVSAAASGAARQPGPWRLVPIPLGLAMVAASTIGAQEEAGLGYGRFSVLVAGGVLCAAGLVVVLPVFTRLMGDLVVRFTQRPSLRIAGRRLQGQPAGVSRIVAGLLVGLFVVAGARMVLGAFETSPQYRAADRAAHGGVVGYDVIGADDSTGLGARDLARRVASLDGVLTAYPSWQVSTACGETGPCLSAFVGTCADLRIAVPGAVGCRDDEPAWLDSGPDPAQGEGDAQFTWGTGTSEGGVAAPSVTVAAPPRDRVISSAQDEYAVGNALQGRIFLPEQTPGIAGVLDSQDTYTSVAVTVDASVLSLAALKDELRDIAPGAEAYDPWEDDSYDFVAGLRALTWGIGALVLAIGLIGFAVATIDRAVSRRAEMVALQLIGTSRGVIRAAQWWEAVVPLVAGVVIAVGTGSAVGYGYLAIAERAAVPWESIGVLAAVSAVASIGVAGLTVLACAPPIRAELIRRA